ncbi:hypothetical protein STRCI_000738 [Streptomyces cinnabarinus]|uniref:DUF6924 domain-containing protein n=1 Tax=Streptomyces cinnabarinus TaxID=67287 RepID=A0ABY7K9T8_9ACTN|nr:hypothetical protein [Streptomyces cinnabarinus]WAZ19671.1 hypothetical protein STRCI_000738 [Streptomyces cinnabarinus]
MRPLIDRTGHDFETEALVVRTDFSDDGAWRVVVEQLAEGCAEYERDTHVVDDRAFEGASPEVVVLSTLLGDPRLEVVFLADAASMRGEYALLAVSTRDEELDEDDDEELGCVFRLLPALVNEMHVNLAIGHLDFWEYAHAAAQDPEHILRT